MKSLKDWLNEAKEQDGAPCFWDYASVAFVFACGIGVGAWLL